MRSIHSSQQAPQASVRRSVVLPGVLTLMLLGAGMVSPTAATSAATLQSQAPFPVWNQGFNHDTEGWYDAETAGALGWCGSIERQTRSTGGQRPSAGRAYATVEGGPCNEFWSSQGVPYGGPYGPGPEQTLASVWPNAGYVTELDLYLDPAWSAEYSGALSAGTLVDYGATIFPLDPEPGPAHTGPHYFVGVEAAEDALVVQGHPVTSAGWYTFRFVFADDDGHVEVAFELHERHGGLLTEQVIQPVRLEGPVKVPFTQELLTPEWGSGYVWFFDIAPGLQLPIDEHRVRPGR